MNDYQWSDLHVGLRQSFKVSVTAEMMDRFRELTGDVNPLHADPAYARSSGFDDVVVYGMLTASFFSTLAGVYLPGKRALLHGVSVDFLRPARVGMKLEVSGEIVHLSEVSRQATVNAEVRVADERLCKAKIRVGVRE